jgi:hypothetical protein
MTQTTTPKITLYAVYGKDRLFDEWVKFESRWEWQARQWADQRAWVRYDSEGELLIERRQPAAQARIEWRNTEGVWTPYSAPMSYAYQVKWLEQHDRMHPQTVGWYRVVEVPSGE